jgi:hypothetical protein
MIPINKLELENKLNEIHSNLNKLADNKKKLIDEQILCANLLIKLNDYVFMDNFDKAKEFGIIIKYDYNHNNGNFFTIMIDGYILFDTILLSDAISFCEVNGLEIIDIKHKKDI